MERILDRNEKAYKNMMAVAKMLEAVSKSGITYRLENIYYDMGQDWWWTTIVAHDPSVSGFLSEWQVLNPREWKEIEKAETIVDLVKITEGIMADKYFKN